MANALSTGLSSTLVKILDNNKSEIGKLDYSLSAFQTVDVNEVNWRADGLRQVLNNDVIIAIDRIMNDFDYFRGVYKGMLNNGAMKGKQSAPLKDGTNLYKTINNAYKWADKRYIESQNNDSKVRILTDVLVETLAGLEKAEELGTQEADAAINNS